MSWPATLAMLGFFAASMWRWRRTDPSLDGLITHAAVWLTIVALVATGLGLAGSLRPWPLTVSLTIASTAAIAWPHERTAPRPFRWSRSTAAALVLLAIGVVLRLPPIEYALAGRDQGTYLLRARQAARDGRFTVDDDVLVRAAAEAPSRSGPADVLGLYPTHGEAWREGVYEGAYRPGLYLESREHGHIVPQFFHFRPAILAAWSLAFGHGKEPFAVTIEGLLTMLGLWAIARRLWPASAWPLLPIAIMAVSPIAIWVHRNTLSEPLTGALWVAAGLAVLRAMQEENPRRLVLAAFLLGATAWVRGNAWLAAPLMLAPLWFSPSSGRSRRRAPAVFLAVLLGSVMVHAFSVFPYLHDELARQTKVIVTHPGQIVGAAFAATAAWWGVDRLVFEKLAAARPSKLGATVRALPRLFAGAVVVIVAFYLATRAAAPAKPYSRLDPVLPLLGSPILVLGAGGLVLFAKRYRPTGHVADVWALAIIAAMVSELALYANRNLPQVGLYYYGRYLVLTIVPALSLLATAATRSLHETVRQRRPALARFSTAGIVLVLVGSTAGVLVTHPITRLQEFEGSDRAVEFLASHIPREAVVIAGGEGWHNGHTYNQIGGALRMTHARSVVPYRSDEAVYATLHELLVGRPAATSEPPPLVYLLVNEATHPHRPDKTEPMRIAVDDRLPAPFVASEVGFLEIYLHRLTPTNDAVPTRVTRDALRMALMKIEVDRDRLEQIESWRLADGRIDGPTGLRTRGVKWRSGHACLRPSSALEIRFPPRSGPVALVLVATAGTARHNHEWQIEVDDELVPLDMPRAQPRERDTLGPILLRDAPQSVRIVGTRHASADAPCPNGGLAELRLLPPDVHGLETSTVTFAATLVPRGGLGHDYPEAVWVPGRGLSRNRSGFRHPPQVHATSLVLRPDEPIDFPVSQLPAAANEPVDVLVHLTQTRIGPDARLVVSIDGAEVVRLDPPDERASSWQSPPVRFTPSSLTAAIRLELVDPTDPDESIHVRDVGVFSVTRPAIPSRIASP